MRWFQAAIIGLLCAGFPAWGGSRPVPPAQRPAPVVRGVLSLGDCIRLALQRNPDLAAVRKEAEIQRLEKPLARAAFLPTLDLESAYTRFQRDERVIQPHRNNELGVFDEDLLEAAMVLRLPLFQGGRRFAFYRIADLARRNAVERLTTTRQDLVLNVASFYYKILQLGEVIRATGASLKALRSQQKTTRLRVRVGRIAPLDGMKVDVRVVSLEQRLSALRADRRVLRFELGRLMGIDMTTPAVLNLSGKLAVRPKRLPDLEQGRTLARTRRSELHSARLELEQAKQALVAARADYWPRLEGFARYGLRSGIPYDQDRGGDHEIAWSAGVVLDLPLFRGGATRTRVAQAQIRVAQARDRLRGIELRIDEELQRAFANLDDSRTRVAVTEKNVAVAREALRIEQAKYRDGKNTINDVLDAQAAMLKADVEYSQASMDYLLARLAWVRATGGDLISFVESGCREPTEKAPHG